MNTERKVLAFHYAWYGVPWGPGKKWQGWKDEAHNSDKIVGGRRNIKSPHYPLDGVYDSLDVSVINRQFVEAKEANLDGVIVSWWGFESYSHKVLEALLDLAPKNFITIYYETAMTFKQRDLSRENAIERIYLDLKKLLAEQGIKDRWIHVDGKPLVVLYIVENYRIDEWLTIKRKLSDDGYEPFFLGDTYNVEYLDVMDGLHTYNPVWITLTGLSFTEIYDKISLKIHDKGKLFAATVCPGYDDRKVRDPGIFISRADGHYYNLCWEAARKSKADWVLVTSWNEWFEGTEIEPSLEYGKDYIYLTRQNTTNFKS